MVMLIVNYDGVWEDVDFNPKTIFLLAVTPKDTLKTLSDKICDRFGLNCDAVDMKFSTLLSECKGSWTWFLSELKKGIGSPQDLVIVSDRHRGIISAMNEVFPYAQHAFCVFHIAQKFRRSSKNRSLAREFFYNACYKHRRDECDIDLQQMAACNQREMGQGCVNVSADEWAVRLCRSVPPYKNICSESDFVNRCCDSLKDLLDVTIEYKKVVERNEARSRSRSTVVESRVAELERDVYRLKNTKSTSLVDHLRRQEGCTLFKNRPSGSRH
ncbi:hypothetical protein LWI29_032189 [Acer saccharum]|uniref:MULE transposase domain-containing protein n=1 Tax=Acer saccharum TaxID=4024 RepID=A0AA39ULV8_ACESA|nr:hypothetical protein LWI29_032189 [Acer saccharum]